MTDIKSTEKFLVFPGKNYHLEAKLILNDVYYPNSFINLIINKIDNELYRYDAYITNNVNTILVKSITGLGLFLSDNSFISINKEFNFSIKSNPPGYLLTIYDNADNFFAIVESSCPVICNQIYGACCYDPPTCGLNADCICWEINNPSICVEPPIPPPK